MNRELFEMVRTQVRLTEDQARRVKRIAAERRVSMATVIRQGVDLLLRSAETIDAERADRAVSAAGRFRSGGGDGAEGHDRCLGEAYRG